MAENFSLSLSKTHTPFISPPLKNLQCWNLSWIFLLPSKRTHHPKKKSHPLLFFNGFFCSPFHGFLLSFFPLFVFFFYFCSLFFGFPLPILSTLLRNVLSTHVGVWGHNVPTLYFFYFIFFFCDFFIYIFISFNVFFCYFHFFKL